MTNEERREATEWFRNRAKNCPMQGARRMYEIATEALEERERNEQQHWIPVTERLPEKGVVVLAFGTRSATTGQFQGVGTAPWFWWWKGHTIKRVTHWMPLPEPPKEET